MKLLCVAGFIVMCGCIPAQQFVRGFEREALNQIADEVSERVGEELPKPSPATDNTLWGGLGALVAYALGSVGKGYLRGKMAEKDKA